MPPTPKEPGYFALPAPLRTARAGWYTNRVLRLRELCARGMDRAATFDGTAYYLQWGAPAARALKAAAPWARAVLLFREPVARAVASRRAL